MNRPFKVRSSSVEKSRIVTFAKLFQPGVLTQAVQTHVKEGQQHRGGIASFRFMPKFATTRGTCLHEHND